MLSVLPSQRRHRAVEGAAAQVLVFVFVFARPNPARGPRAFRVCNTSAETRDPFQAVWREQHMPPREGWIALRGNTEPSVASFRLQVDTLVTSELTCSLTCTLTHCFDETLPFVLELNPVPNVFLPVDTVI